MLSVTSKRQGKRGVVALLFVCVLMSCAVSTQGASPHHVTCAHDEVAVPLHSLPAVKVETAPGAAQVTQKALRMNQRTFAKAALQHEGTARIVNRSFALAEQLSEQGLRPLVFNTRLLLDEACTTVSQTVAALDGSSQQVTCTAADILTQWKRQYTEAVLQKAVAMLSAMLYTMPTLQLPLPRDACTDITNDETTVQAADFVLFVSAMPRRSTGSAGTSDTSSPTSGIAWGRPCVRAVASGADEGQSLGRPVVGQINFIPASVRMSARVAEFGVAEVDVRVAMHEVAHALGFTSLVSTLDSYIDAAGTRQASGGVARVYRAGLGKTVTLVQTPRVVAAAQRHFGCPSLDGVEVEDNGGPGTAGSHWKQRLFLQEALVGTISAAALFFSSITLAVFEDAGFYVANYDLAEDAELLFGKDAGCDFVLENCKTYSSTTPSEEFCFSSREGKAFSGDSASVKRAGSEQRCTFDRRSIGYCSLVTYESPLPSFYQYFDGYPSTGGSVNTMDYCPFIVPYDNLNCVQGPLLDANANTNAHTPGGTGNFRLSPLANTYGNEYGPSSRCFVSNLYTSALPLPKTGARCFPHVCTPHGQLLLQVQGQTVPCPADGSAGRANTSLLQGVHGFVQCPTAAELCPSPSETPQYVAQEPSGAAQNPATTPKNGAPATRPMACSTRRSLCGVSLRLAQYFPLCAKAAKKARTCVGVECTADAAILLSDAFTGPLSRWCARDRQRVANACVDGWDGARALCEPFTLDI